MRLTFKYIKARLRNAPNEARNGFARLQASILGNGIAAYWYNYYNAGDQLTPVLLRHYGFRPYCVLPEKSALAGVGSLLEDLPSTYSGVIFGSGFIKASSRMPFPKARVLAVRGHLTRERLGLAVGSVTLGDPGLLVSELMPRRERKRFVLGLLPHYVDRGSAALAALCRRHPREIRLINIVRDKPMRVVREIDECEHILSSSLHGLIMSDSLGIPNGWFFSDGIIGGRFKYDDYYSALGLGQQTMHRISGEESLTELLSRTSAKPNEAIDQLKKGLDEAFLKLREMRLGLRSVAAPKP
jgi:hypothetical protein